MKEIQWETVEALMEQLLQDSQTKMLAVARKIVPYVTSEDILQPNDYPELENDPLFRYEEGIFAGLLSASIALKGLKKDISS